MVPNIETNKQRKEKCMKSETTEVTRTANKLASTKKNKENKRIEKRSSNIGGVGK